MTPPLLARMFDRGPRAATSSGGAPGRPWTAAAMRASVVAVAAPLR